MIQHRLAHELDKVAFRFRLLRFWQWLAAAWLVAAIAGLALWGVRAQVGPLTAVVPLLCLATGVLAVLGIWRAATSARSPGWVAHKIEAAYPELHSCLLAAVEQRPDLPGGRYGYLQASVIHQALAHADRHPWQQVVPTHKIAAAFAANLATFVMFLVAVAVLLFSVSPASTALVDKAKQLLPSGTDFAVMVEPGDTEVERGTSLLVLARVAGPMPPEATLVYQTEAGEDARLPMSASLEDPVFGGRIPLVDGPLDYHVELGGQTTPTYRVTVFEYPRLERADAKLVYPQYTGLEPKLVEDVRTVSVVEGTEVTLICKLNKPIVTAALTEGDLPPLVLTLSADTTATYQTTLRAEKTRRLVLALVDEAGRKNTKEARFTINVLPNQPVQLKAIFPAKDLEVSPLEELDLRASVWDDFGLVRYGVSYSMAGQPNVDLVLGEKAAPRQKHEMAGKLRLEDLQAEPDQLLSYYFWAEDHAADGTLRRTESDMYFAEVRPFEEIFRQGEQPPGGEQQQQQQQQQGQGQNAQQAQQLAQRQKEIINATWKVLRREIGPALTDAFASDVEQIHQSQTEVLEQAAGLADRIQDAESQEHVADVLKNMQAAADKLEAAKSGPSRDELQAALPVEQAAYQSLLKLRAREHRVIRQQQQRQQGQQRSQSQSSARSQQQRQQLQQLDLRSEENRYETQRTAQEQQQEQAADRENRQVLNRLRELAQRQQDLNERVKELQTALEEARTQAEQEEIRRRLARLQEEQRQMLQDTDELQSRMESPENQERMAESRQQLEETRDDVRRASEALDQERVSQAAAAGTRAEQQFENLRNEFRRQAANRFTEEMREMQQNARELDETQRELNQQLTEDQKPAEQPNRSLREDNRREELANQLDQQRERLGNLQEQMRQTIQDAEQAEPLLSERLYDAARNAQDQNVDRALETARQSLRQGLLQDAQQQEEAAGRGISQLREGVEKAAEAVLGDETEALRRAREELQNLSREINNEINRNRPPGQNQQEGQQQDGQRQPREGEQQQGQNQQGQNQQGQQQQGQNQQGQQQGQPGERQPGQQQGEQQSGQRGQQQPGQQQPGQEQQPGQQGQQSGQRGQRPGQQQPGQQQGEQQPGQRGQQPGQQEGQQPGQQGGQRGEQQPGQRQPGERQPGQLRPGERTDRQRLNDDGAAAGARPFTDSSEGEMLSPLTGEDFRDWSDRLRDVEEMVEDPALRAEAARIRERARNLRAEFKRHSAEPNWDLVQMQIAEPLGELRDRVAEELLRRTSKQALVPLDRDPVPPRYTEKTRQYYERLGSGK